MQVPSLGQEDPLEEGMATHTSILAWRIPWTEEPGGLQPVGLQRVRHDLSTAQQQHGHIHNATCEIDHQRGAAVYHSELSSVLSDDLEGWDWRRWERGSSGRGYLYMYS